MKSAMAEEIPPPTRRAKKFSSEAPSAKARERIPPQMNARETLQGLVALDGHRLKTDRCSRKGVLLNHFKGGWGILSGRLIHG
jgi:hypothetical protein